MLINQKRVESEILFGVHIISAMHILCDFTPQEEPTFAKMFILQSH
jgi:hypothetical protein